MAGNRPYSTALVADLSDGVLSHPRCVICTKYIPEDRLHGGTRPMLYCSKRCVVKACDRRKRAEKEAQANG